ncbi:MAG: T9SS type A sorting domain-containing protein [Cytophaga sp.]|uniref:T9SS type A sorting domain-containing protein n=1 Tax=Cytophaga sp. TaxID=29535 RepID=UPI003F81452A
MKHTFTILFISLQAFCVHAADVAITIQNFAFSPASVNVSVGDVITWTNLDATTHSVVSTLVPGSAATFTSPNLAQNATFSYTVTAEGSYAYKCGIHSSMTGAFTAAVPTPVIKPTLNIQALYPNPSNSTVTIESPEEIKAIEVYSATGVLIKKETFSTVLPTLNVSELENGTYVLRIISNDDKFDTRRFVKM